MERMTATRQHQGTAAGLAPLHGSPSRDGVNCSTVADRMALHNHEYAPKNCGFRSRIAGLATFDFLRSDSDVIVYVCIWTPHVPTQDIDTSKTLYAKAFHPWSVETVFLI